MAGKRKKSFEELIRDVFKDEAWLNELKPAELVRLLQLYRESKELDGDRGPKETTIRWVEPEEEDD
jgi:hypothetical protein